MILVTCLIVLVGNVPEMSLGQGHVLKFQGQNQLTGHILCIFSLTCPQHVLRVSHMSSLPPGTKNLWINQIFQIHTWKINLIPLCNLSFPNWNYKTNNNSKIKIILVSTKDFLWEHKNSSWCKSHLPPPLCPSWSQQNLDSIKKSLFHSFH